MPERWQPVATLAVYNVVQNTVLPAAGYVPANLGVGSFLVYQARARGCTWDDLGLDLRHWRKSLRFGLVVIGFVAVTMGVVFQIPALRSYLLDQRAQGQPPRQVFFRSLIRFPLGTALFEEIAFRGVVYGTWKRGGQTETRAAFITAAAFGIWHVLPGRTALSGNPLQERFVSRPATALAVAAGGMLTFLASLILTDLRKRTNSLLAPWIVHAGVNSIGYLGGITAWRRHARRSQP